MRVSYEGGASAPRSDIRLIHLQYKVGKILGFNPISHRKDSLFSKLYVSIFLFSFWSLTASTITIKFKYFKRMHFLEDLLDLLEYLSELSFVTACLVSAGSKKWRRVFQSMNACERKFNRVNLLVENTTTLSILGIIFYHVALVALHVFENYLWIMNNQLALVYSFVPFRIALYYQFFSLIYISNFCRMLKRRYHCLRELTREVFTSGNARSKRYLVCRLRRVVSMYRSLYITVEQLNDIFGWQMFFYLECIVVSLVNSANFALNSLSRTNEYSLEERILYNCIYTSIYVVAAIVLVAFCDGVERGSENVALAVLHGVGVTENATLRKELSRTVKHMKKLTAKFSAAGFFNVDQRLSNALYTSVIAYLIIVIQFRGPDERAGDWV